MLLIIPLLALVGLSAFYMLALRVATLAQVLPEQDDDRTNGCHLTYLNGSRFWNIRRVVSLNTPKMRFDHQVLCSDYFHHLGWWVKNYLDVLSLSSTVHPPKSGLCVEG